LIKVKAFGLNRSELFTRQGHSPNVKFPRILGIEATGIVEEAPNGEFEKGDVVATAMGDMGRTFDGGYVSRSRNSYTYDASVPMVGGPRRQVVESERDLLVHARCEA